MRKLGVIALVATGLLIIAEAIPLLNSVGWAFGSLSLPEERAVAAATIAWSLSLVIVTILFGGALIARREQLSVRWFDDEVQCVSSSDRSLVRIGLVIIGVVMVALAIPDLIGTVARVSLDALQKRMLALDSVGTPSILYDNIASLLASSVQLAIGFVLVVKSASLSGRLWNSPSQPTVGDSRFTCPSCGTPYDPDDYSDLATARCIECRSPLSTDV